MSFVKLIVSVGAVEEIPFRTTCPAGTGRGGSTTEGEALAAKYQVGDRVGRVGETDGQGVIVGPAQNLGSSIYYQVLFPGSDGPIFLPENELVLVEGDPGSPAAWLLAQPLADARPFGEYYTLLKLRNRLTDHLYSYLSSRTIFRVYQFKPVLKLMGSPHMRLLIADEVGLGKTIEAGLIWSELDARTSLDRVLIVCPSGLRRKWQIEMERRFDRDVPVLSSKAQIDELLDKYERQGESSRFKAIGGLESLRGRGVLERLREVAPTFDLVIVDEAHHMRNTGRLSYELGEFLSEAADCLVFLTATPLNLGTRDLFNLINLLTPEEFDSPELFERLLEPNEFVNLALRRLRQDFPPDTAATLGELRKVEATPLAERYTRNPYYREAVSLLEAGVTARREVVELQRVMTELNTLAQVYSRTRKRDLSENFAVREPVTLTVDWSEEEWAVYNAATRYTVSTYRRVHASGAPLGFVTMGPQRQAASCLPVMRDYLMDVLEKHRITLDLEEGEEEGFGVEDRAVATATSDFADDEISALREAYEAASALGDRDTKYETLIAHLRRIVSEEPDAQVLIFSFFLRTLAHLQERLRRDGFSVEKMDGKTDRPQRERLMEEFRAGSFQILLSSEVGAEGLDFEFCRFMVNYDLPWNPMRLEQRIGRLDRFGQRHQSIVIINFRVDGTVESDVFERLYDRIGIFNRSIGELEPILGEAIREIEQAVLSPELTPEQKRKEADRIAHAIESRSVALEEFEETRARLVGQDDYVVDQLDDIERTRRYITPEELERLFRGFLERVVAGRSSLRGDEAEPRLFYLRASPKIGDLLRTFARQHGSGAVDLLTQLESGSVLPITFHPDVASQRRAEFLNLRHPIIRSIVDFYRNDEARLYRAGKVRFEGEPKGEYIFWVFLLEATGLVPRHQLFGVAVDSATEAVNEDASEVLLPALSALDLQDPERTPTLVPDHVNRCCDAALAYAFSARESLKDDLERTNEAIAVNRRDSLLQSLEVRRTRIQGQIETATNERIIRMRTSQLSNLEGRVRAQVDEIEHRRTVSVSLEALAGGYLEIV
jgi:SNF2 family DNA or RNA helicase